MEVEYKDAIYQSAIGIELTLDAVLITHLGKELQLELEQQHKAHHLSPQRVRSIDMEYMICHSYCTMMMMSPLSCSYPVCVAKQ